MTVTKEDIDSLTLEEIELVNAWIYERRVGLIALENYADDVARLNATARKADPTNVVEHASGAPYVPVTGYQDAYPIGSVVLASDGNLYVATQDGAWQDPITLQGWQRQAQEGVPVPWTAPHAGEEYAIGALVTFNGHVWRNDLDKVNGFQPGQTGSGWTDLGPYSE